MSYKTFISNTVTSFHFRLSQHFFDNDINNYVPHFCCIGKKYAVPENHPLDAHEPGCTGN